MNKVELKKDGLYLNDEKFFLLSGDFHYFRTVPDGWRRRLKLMKDFGLTAVTTYVAWNVHEPERGVYNFDGIGDLPRFLKECDEEGLKVVLRCSPYMCAEWEMGGLPYWLNKDRTLTLRSSDPKYFEPMAEYMHVLADKVRPYLFTNGGPIILVGLENEYGSFGNDKEYLVKLAKLYEECGFDVPFISANGSEKFKYLNGTLEKYWNGVDSSAVKTGIDELNKLKAMQPDKPLLAGEAWCGDIMFWGKPFNINQHIEENAEYFKEALNMGALVNFYMFVGGTNWAFFSGALACNDKKRYESLMTSYDYDAPVGEDGTPREKYFALRDALDEFLGKPKRPHEYTRAKTQEISDILIDGKAPLFSVSKDICALKGFFYKPLTMEELNQDYGYIKYTTFVEYTDDYIYHIRLDDLRDRATVYLDGKFIGAYMRDRDNKEITFSVKKGGSELTILVENMGRVGYGYKIYEQKGLISNLRYEIECKDGSYLWNYAVSMGFDTETLPMKKLDKIKFTAPVNSENDENLPVFYHAKFKAQAGVDTFLDTKPFSHGFAVVNGFNVGKFLSEGPQRTLYIPGEILKDKNEIIIFELSAKKTLPEIKFLKTYNLTDNDSDVKFEKFELL